MMKDWQQFERNTIETLAEEIGKLEMPFKLFEPEEKMPVQILVTILDDLGEKEQSVKLEICFLPIEEEQRKDASFNYIQFFSILGNDIRQETAESLLKFINYLNTVLPIGNIALGENDKILCMKYRFPLLQNMNKEQVIMMMDAVLAVYIHTLDTYTDAITEVAAGRLGADEAIRYCISGDNRGERQ